MFEYLDIAIGFAAVMLLLSLVVTAIVQALSTLLDLRGNYLVSALAKLFEQLPIWGPTGKDALTPDPVASKELALAVARHSAIAPSAVFSWWRKAKAIRRDELENIIHRLAEAPPADLGSKAQEALKNIVETRAPGLPDSLGRFRQLVAPDDPLRKLVEQAMQKTQVAGGDLAAWFDAVMDRSSDRFARNAKVWSAAVGAVLALGLQVNAISIFTQINGNAAVRTQLASMAQPAMDQAKQIESFVNVAGKTLADMKQQEAYKAVLQNAPASMARCADGAEWIRNNAKNDGLLADFQKQCAAQAVAAVGVEFPVQVRSLQESIEKAQLNVFGYWRSGFSSPELFGCLVTVILLSLGGPFWFNLLRQMATLRPPISQKITDEQRRVAEAAAARLREAETTK
jgi:hypothetical protein